MVININDEKITFNVGKVKRGFLDVDIVIENGGEKNEYDAKWDIKKGDLQTYITNMANEYNGNDFLEDIDFDELWEKVDFIE